MSATPHPSKAIPRAVGISLMLAVLFGGVWLLFDKCQRMPVDGAKGLAAVLKDALRIETVTRHENKVYLLGSKGIFEAAFAEEALMVEDRFEHSFAGSTKTLHVRGIFTAKAGYKLDGGNWHAEFRPDGSSLVALPAPSLLSCELKEVRSLVDADGWWNKLTSADRDQATNRLLEKARQQALANGLARKAEEEMNRRLREAAANHRLAPPAVIDSKAPAS